MALDTSSEAMLRGILASPPALSKPSRKTRYDFLHKAVVFSPGRGHTRPVNDHPVDLNEYLHLPFLNRMRSSTLSQPHLHGAKGTACFPGR
jgi:hypothetical protein